MWARSGGGAKGWAGGARARLGAHNPHIPSHAPRLFFTVLVVYPLCMTQEMRKLDIAGAVGSSVLWILAGIIFVKACIDGLPAFGAGTYTVWGSSTLSERGAGGLRWGAHLPPCLLLGVDCPPPPPPTPPPTPQPTCLAPSRFYALLFTTRCAPPAAGGGVGVPGPA